MLAGLQSKFVCACLSGVATEPTESATVPTHLPGILTPPASKSPAATRSQPKENIARSKTTTSLPVKHLFSPRPRSERSSRVHQNRLAQSDYGTASLNLGQPHVTGQRPELPDDPGGASPMANASLTANSSFGRASLQSDKDEKEPTNPNLLLDGTKSGRERAGSQEQIAGGMSTPPRSSNKPAPSGELPVSAACE